MFDSAAAGGVIFHVATELDASAMVWLQAQVRPPACPRAATLASAPAPKYNDERAEQPVATENPRLPHLTYPTTIRFARLKRLFFVTLRSFR